MIFSPIFIGMTFIKAWRIRAFRARLLDILSGNSSVLFCIKSENNSDTPFHSSKLCCDMNNDIHNYTNSRIMCSMKPVPALDISNWVSFKDCVPFKSTENNANIDADVDVLLECQMKPCQIDQNFDNVNSIGLPVAWRADICLTIVLKTSLENFSTMAFNFMEGSLVIDHQLSVNRIQTVSVVGEPKSVTDLSIKSLKNDIEHSLQNPVIQWSIHAALLRKLTKIVDIEFDSRKTKVLLNGGTDLLPEDTQNIISEVSVNSTNLATGKDTDLAEDKLVDSIKNSPSYPEKTESAILDKENMFSLKPVKHSNFICASPNILIYADSDAVKANLEASLKRVLDCDRYTLYSISRETLEAGAWRGRAALVAVAGCVGRSAPLLLAHLLDGGRLLALCSDLLHAVLPYYKTAEIRKDEIVPFTFDKWKSVKMKHHILCQDSATKQSSYESERQPSKYGGHPGHELDIQVLASEETWRTPSLLQATDLTNNGIAIFSQIHLEEDPRVYLGQDVAESDESRLEILHKILGDSLGLHVKLPSDLSNIEYTEGFFLGNHEQKLKMIKQWCGEGGRIQSLDGVTVQWCLRGELPREPPSPTFLPVNVYECPKNFSTVEYFDNLTSKTLGRLVVYSDVVTSTLHVSSAALGHGAACIARHQTRGRGRTTNTWLSPVGQACISLEIWQKITPSLPLIQLASALAVIQAIRLIPSYKDLDINIKWPNDIYYGREIKIGGTSTFASCMNDDVIVVVGTGVNISNESPTTCVNAIIAAHNRAHGTALAPMSAERFLARYCSQLERILDYMRSDGGLDAFTEQYYQYWLHTNEEIRVLSPGSASAVTGVIKGVDCAGWLIVDTEHGEVQVTPDGNTFDMMSGLIAPKW